MHPTVRKRIDEVEDRINPFYTKINIIVTGTSNQRIFMLPCLKSIRSIGWMLMTYDNPVDDYNNRFPSSECFKLLDQFFMKHNTSVVPGPTYPQFWNYKHGIDILRGSPAEYVFTIGADCVLERPEGISEIVKMLGNNDLISCSTGRHKVPYCGTKSFLIRKTAFIKIVKYLEEKTYYPFQDIGNMEYRFGLAVQGTGIKEVKAPKNPSDDQFSHSYDEEGYCINRGTWGEVLGFRHLAGEHKIRRLEKRIPVEEKYFDKKYLSRSELETISKYWETKDKKFLESWWKS